MLIYELNKCASTPNSASVISCNKHLSICQEYVKSKDTDFATALESFPTKYIRQEYEKIKKINEDKLHSAANYDDVKKTANGMNNIEKLTAVIVTLVTMAKENNSKNATTASLYWSALEEFKWDVLKKGKIRFHPPRYHLCKFEHSCNTRRINK